MMRIAVLGGAGMMGRITVRDLVETAPAEVEILIADYDLAAADALAKTLGSPRLRTVRIDANDVADSAQVLAGSFMVVNTAQHKFNVPVMEACLRAGSHYTDLGGLFHVTRKQLELHSRFREAGLVAVLGMGAAPGIVNVLARKAADPLDRVDEIHVLVGSEDNTVGRTPSVFGASYSMETIIEEATEPAALFTGGDWAFVEALSGESDVDFPAPVGRQRPARTLHSEVATLPLSYRDKGVREVSFRIAFSEDLVTKLRFLRSLGLFSITPVRVGGAEVSPRSLMLRLLRDVPPGDPGGVPNEYEVLRVVVIGSVGGREIETTIDCHCRGIPEWGFGVDVDTGCPPSIVAQLILRREISGRGCLPPELAVPVAPFVAELEKRHMRIEERTVNR